jgi:hypothetical protein
MAIGKEEHYDDVFTQFSRPATETKELLGFVSQKA